MPRSALWEPLILPRLRRAGEALRTALHASMAQTLATLMRACVGSFTLTGWMMGLLPMTCAEQPG